MATLFIIFHARRETVDFKRLGSVNTGAWLVLSDTASEDDRPVEGGQRELQPCTLMLSLGQAKQGYRSDRKLSSSRVHDQIFRLILQGIGVPDSGVGAITFYAGEK